MLDGFAQIIFVAEYPQCDFCDNRGDYYAKHRTSELWAHYCTDHFRTESRGQLGTDTGQRLVRHRIGTK